MLLFPLHVLQPKCRPVRSSVGDFAYKTHIINKKWNVSLRNKYLTIGIIYIYTYICTCFCFVLCYFHSHNTMSYVLDFYFVVISGHWIATGQFWGKLI